MLHSQHTIPPFIKELSEKLKEPLKTIKLLHVMKVLVQKTSLPPIIVLGEAGASAGSVISTLVGINLPPDLGVTLVLKFTTDGSIQSRKIWMTFLFEDTDCEKEVSEALFASEIEELVKQIPKDKRSKIEVTLTVIQPQVSDLTIILLPEIYTQYSEAELTMFTPWQNMGKEEKEIDIFRGYIRRYTKYDNCVFLNVLPCPSNINSYQSRQILKEHDCFGRDIVTVFTKPDLSSEYMITRLTSKNAIKVPFGYFFVDNIIEADEKTGERVMLSSKFDEDYIGFDVISKNLVIAMLSILFHPYSFILNKIKSDLKESALEIKQSQKTFDSVSDAALEIWSILNTVSIGLHRLFLEWNYEGYWKDEYMHVASNIARKFRRFKIDLQDLKFDAEIPFLQYEIELLNSKSHYNPPCFYTRSDIISLLDEQFSYASSTIDPFVSDIMNYIKGVVVKVCLDRSKKHLQLRQHVKKVGRVLVEGVQRSFEENVKGMLDIEKNFLYTCDDDFDKKVIEMRSLKLELEVGKEVIDIDGLGKNIRVDHLKSFPVDQIERAFELKKLIVVYWEFVVKRFVDYCSLNLQFLISEMTGVRIRELMKEHFIKTSKDGSKLPDVEPLVAYNKSILENRTEYLIEVMKDIEKWQVEV